jgi:predicted RNase H-like HicB family nuclease
MKQTTKDLGYYMALPYTIQLTPIEDYWFVKIPLLEGCMSHGDSQAEALEMIEDAKLGWLTDALETGSEIPEPKPEEVTY